MRTLTVKTIAVAAALMVAGCARVDQVNSPSAPNSAPAGITMLAPSASNLIGPPSVPGAVPAPLGMRACFAGDGNGLDIVSNNVGVATGTASFTAGKFGQAFDFLALGDGYTVQPSASLNFGASGTGITMTAWIYGRGTMFQAGSGIVGAGPIVEYNNGAHMWQHSQQNDPQELFSNLAEGNQPSQWHIIRAPGTLPLNGWYHTAVTYDKGTGLAKLYVNGVERASQNFGVFSPNTSTPLHIGKRVTPIIGPADFTFNGAVDEVQIYERGLTAAEIAQIAGATGTMCVPPPVSFEVMAMPPVNAESGVPLSPAPTVAILDANNNIVSNATTAVTATIASGTGTLIGTTTVNAVNGIATFDNLAVAGDAIVTIGFGADGLPPEPGTVTVSFPVTSVQVPRQLGIVTQPGGALSGSPLAPQPIVEIRDAAGLRIPGTTLPISVATASGTGTLSGTTTVAALDARATFTNLAITGAGTSSLTFSSGALIPVTSNVFTIVGLPGAQLAILTAPAGSESGVALTTQPVIEVQAANGTRATTATGTVTASIISGSGSLGGTVTVPIVDGLANFSNLQINGYGSFTLQFSSGSLTPVSAPAITSVQVPRQLAITSGPAVITSDVVMNPPFVLEIRDAAGIRVANSVDIVRMSQISGAGTLDGDRQIPAVNGVVTYSNVTVNGGSSTVAFNFWVIDANTGAVLPVFALSNVVTVLANNTIPSSLAVVTQPGGAESGVALTTQPTVEVRSAAGTRVTTATGTMTATLISGTGTLAGTVTAPIVNGLATFTDLKVNGFGSFTLQFTSGTLTPVNSNPFNSVQVVRSLAILAGPSSTTSGATMSPAWVVELRDGAGLRVATSTYLTTMSVASGGGSLSGTLNVNAVGGVATFANAVLAGGTSPATFRFQVTDAASTIKPSVVSGPVVVNSPPPPPPPAAVTAAIIRKGVTLNSATIQGSLQILNADDVTVGGNGRIAGTLYLPGMPTLRLTGQAAIANTVDGTGSATPTAHTVRMTGQGSITTLTRRTNPTAMPIVAPPAAPTGTRNVVLNSASDPIGAWATVRNFTMNGNAGSATMPGGAYGDVTVGGQNTLVLGVAGTTTPTVYSFQNLVLNGGSSVRVVGPVVVTVGSNVALNGNVGAASNPEWLLLKLYRADLTVHGGASFHGVAIAPDGTVTVNGNSSFIGGLAADDLTLLGTSEFRITKSVPTP